MTTNRTTAQPTIRDLSEFQTEVEEKFGRTASVAYANVTNTQMSIARHYGGMKVNGKDFTYNWVDDSLIRNDVAMFISKLIKQREN